MRLSESRSSICIGHFKTLGQRFPFEENEFRPDKLPVMNDFLLASDCATQAMYFGRYVEVGVESPPIWRVASSCIDGDMPKALHAIQGDQGIPIGEPGDRGLRSFGDGKQIAFQGEWRERITGFILAAPEQSPREFVRLDPITQGSPQRLSRLRPRCGSREAQAWRTKQNV